MARRDLGNLRKELHNALLLGDTQRFARKDCIFYRRVRACRAVLVSRIRFSTAQAIPLTLTKDFSRAEVVQHVDKSKDYNVSPATYCGTKQRQVRDHERVTSTDIVIVAFLPLDAIFLRRAISRLRDLKDGMADALAALENVAVWQIIWRVDLAVYTASMALAVAISGVLDRFRTALLTAIISAPLSLSNWYRQPATSATQRTGRQKRTREKTGANCGAERKTGMQLIFGNAGGNIHNLSAFMMDARLLRLV
jgi:hypothetical protein